MRRSGVHIPEAAQIKKCCTALVATLAVNALLLGGIAAYSHNTGRSATDNLSSFAIDKTLGIPNTVFVALTFIVAFWFILSRTTAGGGSPRCPPARRRDGRRAFAWTATRSPPTCWQRCVTRPRAFSWRDTSGRRRSTPATPTCSRPSLRWSSAARRSAAVGAASLKRRWPPCSSRNSPPSPTHLAPPVDDPARAGRRDRGRRTRPERGRRRRRAPRNCLRAETKTCIKALR